jgi:hypothetical protein
MYTIRKNVFETNSSMTHALVICENDEYAKWVENYDSENKENGYLFCMDDSKFLPYKEAIEINVKELKKRLENDYLYEEVTENDIEEYAQGKRSITELTDDTYELYITEEEWETDYYYETESFEYTTKSGDKLTGFCYYGHD